MINPEPWVTRPHPGPRAQPLPLTPEQREAVEAAIRPAKAEQRVVLRGQALLLMAAGVSQGDAARALGVHARTVQKWRQRFLRTEDPVSKLADAPRSGRPILSLGRRCGPHRSRGVQTSQGRRHPCHALVGAAAGAHVRGQDIAASDRTVGRILRDADLQPHRQKMYLTSHDDEFRAKRDDVLRVYYDAPPSEHIISVDEQTGMQALERRYADILMQPGQPVRREFEYIRHGTLCLMGAYDVRNRKLFGFTAEKRGSDPFVEPRLRRPIVPRRPRSPRLRQPVRPQHRRRTRLARRPSALDVAFHAQARLLAQPDRVRILDPASQGARPRFVPYP